MFNSEEERGWTPNASPVQFEKADGWKKYVDSRRLEITCGEAPFLVSRYDADTGEIIPIEARIGLLDRKLRIVGENTQPEEEWLKWAYRAFQSVYGYEYQGDNLLIARINLLLTFVEYMEQRWGRRPTEAELKKVANIIVWNIWQMDGLNGCAPFAERTNDNAQTMLSGFCAGEDLRGEGQTSLFDTGEPQPEGEETEETECMIFDWRGRVPVKYNDLKDRERKKVSMRFEIC